jgi:isocitrate lyase
MTTTIQDKAIAICERLSCHEILGDEAACIQEEWDSDPRWQGIKRPYSPEDVLKLRGTLKIEYTLAEGIQAEYPDKLLAYNCSPSFNWKGNLSDSEIANFQQELGAMGYKFQFVTLAGFHALNLGMFDLALSYKKEGMLAYSKFQQEEFAHGKEDGYMAITHQKFVGTGYFDRVMNCITEGQSSVEALEDSTEKAQF